MKDSREKELIQYMANEYVHFYWVKKINRQIASLMLIEEIKKMNVIK